MADIFAEIEKGELANIRALLAEQPSLAGARTEAGLSALMTALYHRRFEIAELLRQTGIELDLFEAAACGVREVLLEKLDESPQALNSHSGDGFTPLHLACFFGRDDVVACLLERGADREAVAANPGAVRPLHSAAASHSLDSARRLLERGAEVDSAQHGGWTALHAAALHGDVELTRLLLSHGADPHKTADDGKNSIDLAVEKGHTVVAKLLKGR